MKLFISTIFLIALFACKPELKEGKAKAPEPEIIADTKPTIIDFKTLSGFELPIENQTIAYQEDIKYISKSLPQKVINLNNKKISIKGFMVPVQFTKEEKIRTFMFVANHGACCFGKTPALNEIIYCSLDQSYPDMRDIFLEVTGTLKTDPILNKFDDTVHLYTMQVDSIKELKTLLPLKRPGISF